ncbi:CLUMA_CG020192, isoform A [Clunio marinus]|uniref:Mediator of RNA polymerase II transcription subunit 16 n=1 Tax=Clunio marinus TaxID=568069 RepID=A0A1J1J8H2_9DIPT|nr:CLUMA_CG020192, isoform A [Clunio marinus]
MENLFNLNHKLVFNKKEDAFGRFGTICKFSSNNLFAYSSEIDIITAEKGFFVYMFDFNLPWYTYKVASFKYPIVNIEWDQSGYFILVADNYGNISVYTMENNLISEWIEVCSVSFPSENIIATKFFNNGIRIAKYQQDKRDQVLYSDKYYRPKFQPTVRKFGGVSDFGCVCVTSTGLIGAFSIDLNFTGNDNNKKTNKTSRNLGQTRGLCTLADISFKNGQFQIAVVNSAQKNSLVQCYRVQIEKIDEDNLVIVSKSLPSFFVNESMAYKEAVDAKIHRLKWMSQEDSDSLIISSNHSSGSIVEIWTLKEEQTLIHKIFQTTKNEAYKTLGWSNQQNYKHSRKVLDVITTKVQFTANFYIFIAYQDSSIHCLNREGLKRVAINNIHLTASALEHQTKQIKITSKITSLDISYMGHILIATDSIGQVSCYRINFDHIMNNLVHAANLFEFCMISGLDTLDSQLLLKPLSINDLVDKLTDNFNRQPNHVTQFYYLKFLTMKINLYRMCSFGQSKAHDLVCLLNLISISTAFKSLLRPADLMTMKNGPAENLAMNLSESSLPDVDKVLVNLEAKDFTVEPSTLQSLQQLIQFVADLALNILSKLPEGRTFLNTNKTTGDLSDFTALNSIRELLVMIRIWGLLKPQCLPVFSRSADNLDILATLFRLLTKLAPKPTDPDDQLLDECCLLPNQVLIPQIQLNTPRISLSSPLLVNAPLPLHLEYNVECDLLDFIPELHYVEGCLMNNNIMDSIRYIHLGKSSANLRRCSRCGSYSSLKSVARTAAMKGWESRWNTCKCGGLWKLEKC